MQFKLIRNLRDAGKLHTRLLRQIRMLGIISLVMLLVVVYQVVRYGLNVWLIVGLMALGFVLGLFVFSKMNNVAWDESKETVVIGRIDRAGVVIIVLYVGFDLGLRYLLKTEFPGTLTITGYLLAAIGASLLGRTLGTLVAIQNLVQKEKVN